MCSCMDMRMNTHTNMVKWAARRVAAQAALAALGMHIDGLGTQAGSTVKCRTVHTGQCRHACVHAGVADTHACVHTGTHTR